jgi:ATP-binding cassette subfamily B protein RaxB
LFGKVIGLKRSLFQVFILAAALEAFGIVAPFLSQWIIDDAIASGDMDLLTVLVIGALLVGLIQMAVGLIRSWVVIHLTTTLSMQWFSNVFAHLFRLPMAWFEKRHLGDVVSRFGSISAIQQALTGGVIGVVLDGIMAVVTLCVMFVYSLQLSAAVLLAVLLYAAVRIARYGALRDASAEQIVLSAKQQSHFMESIRVECRRSNCLIAMRIAASAIWRWQSIRQTIAFRFKSKTLPLAPSMDFSSPSKTPLF